VRTPEALGGGARAPPGLAALVVRHGCLSQAERHRSGSTVGCPILPPCALVPGRSGQLKVAEKRTGTTRSNRRSSTPGGCSRKYLQRLMVGLALVPVATGAVSLVLGTDAISAAGTPSANTESELRFYAVWWIGAGLFLASLAPHIEERGRELRVVCALLALGGVGRALGVADKGWPKPMFVVLMALELLLPLVLVLWQARVAHASRREAAGVPGPVS
jgi:hypothetical protein